MNIDIVIQRLHKIFDEKEQSESGQKKIYDEWKTDLLNCDVFPTLTFEKWKEHKARFWKLDRIQECIKDKIEPDLKLLEEKFNKQFSEELFKSERDTYIRQLESVQKDLDLKYMGSPTPVKQWEIIKEILDYFA